MFPRGTSPLPTKTGAVWVVFNGEIYNYQQLRQDLAARARRTESGQWAVLAARSTVRDRAGGIG
ncbi:MAG: hypothetical protein LLG20_21240 [Acidobacteriales bacterium]|nr:hypothetical protein [Terriglobales bacterium]